MPKGKSKEQFCALRNRLQEIQIHLFFNSIDCLALVLPVNNREIRDCLPSKMTELGNQRIR
jgi:hypothetical protein